MQAHIIAVRGTDAITLGQKAPHSTDGHHCRARFAFAAAAGRVGPFVAVRPQCDKMPYMATETEQMSDNFTTKWHSIVSNIYVLYCRYNIVHLFINVLPPNRNCITIIARIIRNNISRLFAETHDIAIVCRYAYTVYQTIEPEDMERAAEDGRRAEDKET